MELHQNFHFTLDLLHVLFCCFFLPFFLLSFSTKTAVVVIGKVEIIKEVYRFETLPTNCFYFYLLFTNLFCLFLNNENTKMIRIFPVTYLNYIWFIIIWKCKVKMRLMLKFNLERIFKNNLNNFPNCINLINLYICQRKRLFYINSVMDFRCTLLFKFTNLMINTENFEYTTCKSH